ncbi:MAG: DNRLRE domain-containing protein, partial [Anaerolineales bacterium]|nr:DNRLRE domain-containing protein [Anaerolineales bacterium]
IAIISATVELFNIINEPNNTPQTVQDNDLRAEAVLGAWTEGGATWNNRPPSSYLDDPPTTWAVYGWTKFDVTNIVQGWVDGGIENHGILLRTVPGPETGSFYFSRETNVVPVLKIAYEPAPPACEPLAVMVINGPTEAKRGISYTYDATISPVYATGPISYTWTSDGQPTQTTPTAVFNWDTTGNKTVNLTVQNCGGQTSNLRHTVITDPAPNCPAPLTDLQISGPTTAVSNRALLFEAVVGPDEATTPISFQWQVTGQANRDTTGDLLADSINTTFGTGPKEVTVTAENCGGTFIRRHALYVDPPSALPDLRITGTWYESEAQRIGYILQNQGGTAAPAGHQTDLFIAGTYQQSQTINQPLPPNGVRVHYFNHNWSCGVTSVPLTLRADALGDVSEGAEANNEHYASWPCDLVPPTLLSGPIISNVTETTATVGWQTSESTHGRVEYGQTSYAPYSQDTPHFTSAHSANLTGLQAGRTYRVRVFGEDNGDNVINSAWVYFQTSPPGTDPPEITDLSVIETPGSPYEMFTIQATLADATYVDRVAFYLDGAH